MNDNKNYNCKFAFASSVSEVENECLVGESCNALDLLKNRLSQSQIIANYATWEWNSDSDRIAWSDNLFTILQYDPVEVTPSIKALFKRIHPEDLKCVHQTIQKSKKEDKTNEIEFRIILPDESIRIIYCYTSLRYDPVSKSNSSIIGTVQDITERKQAELALKESEIKFRNLVEGSLQGIFVHKDFKPLFANQKCIEMFGYESLDEILQLDSILTAFWAKEEQERIEKYKTDRMIGNKDIPIIYECKGRRKDGTEFWFENYVTTVDWDGEKAIQAAVIDISERKQADLALKESDERFRSTFEHGPLGMGTADLDGNILEVNKIFCEIFGYSENEFVKKNIRDFIHPDDIEQTVNNIKRIFSGEKDHYQQIRRYKHKRGHYVWAENNVSAVHDAEGKPKFLINHVQDISERVQSEYLQGAQQNILKQIVNGDSQKEILTNLCFMFESIAPAGAKASVLLLNPEDKKLYIGAAPSLSNVLKSAFNGFITGNNKASCGTAAYLGETVIVEDVASSILWNDFKDFGIDNGILACWSTPFFSENGEVLGTFAISHPKIISPTKHDIERLEMGGYLASIVVVRTRSIQALLNSENKFSTAFRSIPDVVSIASVPDGKFLEVNDHFLDKSGYERDEVIGRTVFELGIWADVTERDQLMSELKEHGVVRDMETKFLSRFGKVHDCLVSAEIITIEQQNYSLAITKDITEQKRLEILQTSRNQILESLAKNHELDTILRMIVVSITDLIPESSISILMSDKDGKYLFNGVSHNLPDFFLESINGLEIATSSCPCTRAANTRKSIIVSDFNNDPDCVNLIELVQQAGLAACWVQPIISSQDNVLGTFTLYFKRAREPGKDEIEIIDSVTRLASIAIERKRDEKTLRESEARFRSAFGNAPTGTALVDKTGVVLQVNARSTSIIGFLPEEIVGKSIVDITHPNDLEKSLEKYKELMTGQIDEYQLEKQYANKQGTYVWCRLSISSVKDDGGIPQYSIAHIEDISERKKSEESLHRYNRALQVLNQCNATLFHSTNAEELLNEVCKIVVQMGGYRFAWVGYIQDDEEKTIKPMAKSGYEEGYLDVKICLNTNDKNYCSLTDAINSLEVKAIRNIKTEKAELNWRDAALKRGYYSTISLPLIVDAQAFGAISIYSGEVDVFDKDEITLLKNLAENLSFGIQSITNRSVREEAEQSLRLSERKFRTLFDENPCMFFTVDDNANILSVNKFGAAELGYKTHQFIGRTLFSVTNDEGMLSVKNYLTECLKNPNKVHRWEMQAARKNGSKLWVRVLARVADDENHKNTILVVCEDITEAHLLSEKLKHEATHDGLTGLINRREFEERLQRAIQSAQKNNQHVLCYLDLDRFKIINDTCGHIAGDKLLKQLSDLLHSHLRSRDSLARLGGDEFGLLIENCEVKTALNIANKLKQEISGFQFYWEEKVFKVGVSIGMVEISARTTDVSDILMLADNACYTAKDKGRDRIYVHEEGDAELENRRNDMLWTTRIQQAFEEDRFRLAYQSIIPIDQIDNKGEHGEILLRMEDEEGNIIPPNAFIPVAERYNQISSIDKHVIEMTFKWLNENHDFLERLYLVSINLSGPSLVDGDVLKCIIQNLLKYNIPGNKICFEITETAAIANLSNANNFISVLKEHGCYFALDDFGSGLSSFAYLKALPVDFLKIDGAFVRDIEHEQGDLAIVKSIHEIGRALNKKTIAEFVENESILQILKGIGVNYAQGFGIDRPRPLIDINTKTNKIEISKKAS